MNATVITDTGEILSLIHDLALYQCHDCREAGVATGFRLLPLAHVGLRDLDPEVPMQFSPRCPHCGRQFELVGRAVAYVPDEDELPALFHLQAATDDGNEERWQLAPFDRGAGVDAYDPTMALNDALSHPDALILDEVSEERLCKIWGRPLSVGNLWLNGAANALAASEESDDAAWVRLEGAAGMWLSVRPPGLSEADLARVAEISNAGVDGETVGRDPALRDLARERAGRWFAELEPLMLRGKAWREIARLAMWASPIREPLSRGFGLLEVDLGEVERLTVAAITRYRLKRATPPRGRESDQAIWLDDRGVRGKVEFDRVAATAALNGMTVAQAATAHVLRRAWELNAANKIVAHMRTLVAEDQIEVVAIDEVIVEDKMRINLENILIKTNWNEDKARASAERMVAARDPQSGQDACPCGHPRPFLHVRLLDDCYGHIHRYIEDYEGTQFALVATLDCEHLIAYPTTEWLAQRFGDDLDTAFERGARQTKLKVHARLLRDLDNEPRAVVVSCDSIASLLAHDGLATTLARTFAPQLGAQRIVALAPFTNVLVLLPSVEDDGIDLVWRDIAIADALRDPMIDSPGKILRYVQCIDRHGKAIGKVDVTWHQSPAPATLGAMTSATGRP